MIKTHAQAEVHDRMEREFHDLKRLIHRKAYEYGELKGPDAKYISLMFEIARDALGKISSTDRMAVVEANVPIPADPTN